MKSPNRLIAFSRARAQARRMNELDRVLRNVLDDEPRSDHRDTESYTERSWQNERTELHIGFRSN